MASIWAPGRQPSSFKNLGRATLPPLYMENHHDYKSEYERVAKASAIISDTSKRPGPPYKTPQINELKEPVERQDFYDDVYYDYESKEDYPQER